VWCGTPPGARALVSLVCLIRHGRSSPRMPWHLVVCLAFFSLPSCQ